MAKPATGGKRGETSAQRREGVFNTHKIIKDLAQQEKKLRPLKHERAYVWDQDGNLLLTKDGSKSEIRFSAGESKLFKDAIMTHNHPSMMGNGFSDPDIATFLKNDMAEMRAVDKGGVFSIKKIKGVKQDPTGLYYARNKNEKEIKKITDAKYQKIGDEYRSGKISDQEVDKRIAALNREFFERKQKFLKANARQYGYHYSFEKQGS